MEQGSYLPFSSLIASMLLFKRHITSLEIVNYISMLCNENIFFDDEFDNIDNLGVCVECFNYAYFEIRKGLSYDSILKDGKTVREFLYDNASEEIIEFIKKRNCYLNSDGDIPVKKVVSKSKVRRKFFLVF